MTRGPIIAIGGNLGRTTSEPILQKFYDLSGEDPVIAVIPTASSTPKESAKSYTKIFEKLGAETLVLNPKEREDANKEEILSEADKATAFFFTGGNQLRITSQLGGTELIDKIMEKHENGFLVGGTSAGAVCLTHTMIASGESEDALLSGELELTHGLGFIEDTVIDTHFTVRGRFPRLIHVVTENPGVLGVGLGEDTAGIWHFEKNQIEVIGSRNIVVVDGKNLGNTNISEIKPGQPLCVESLTIQILVNGCIYDFEKRKAAFPRV